MKRWVPAPGCNYQTANGTVLGVSIEPSERVEWVYTILPDGKRIITGYDILPVLPVDSVDL